MTKQTYHLISTQIRHNACQAIMQAPEGYRVQIGERTRSMAQNDLLWSVLTDLSRQVPWPVNGIVATLTPEEYKDLITASLGQENRMAAGIRGGFVMLGKSTSKMTIGQMKDLITFAHAFGDERGVKWSPTSLGSM